MIRLFRPLIQQVGRHRVPNSVLSATLMQTRFYSSILSNQDKLLQIFKSNNQELEEAREKISQKKSGKKKKV